MPRRQDKPIVPTPPKKQPEVCKPPVTPPKPPKQPVIDIASVDAKIKNLDDKVTAEINDTKDELLGVIDIKAEELTEYIDGIEGYLDDKITDVDDSTVKKDLTNYQIASAYSGDAYIYIDNNGTPQRIKLSDVVSHGQLLDSFEEDTSMPGTGTLVFTRT